MVTLADMEGNEAFDAANLGTAEAVEVIPALADLPL